MVDTGGHPPDLVLTALIEYFDLSTRSRTHPLKVQSNRVIDESKMIRENFTLEMFTFNRYSLQSVTIRENFPVEKLRIVQFVKNNPLYDRLAWVFYAKTTARQLNGIACRLYTALKCFMNYLCKNSHAQLTCKNIFNKYSAI